MHDRITIADNGEENREPTKTYGEEEVVAISNEFLDLVKGFCDKYQAAVIGELLFTKDDDTNAMLFVMHGAFPDRAAVDLALVNILIETRAYYEEHEKAL